MGRENGKVELKGLNKSGRFPSGNARYYYRPKGQKGVPLPDLPPNHPDFLSAYADARRATPLKTDDVSKHGSLGAGIMAWLASDIYLGYAASTRESWARIASKILKEYGDLPISGLRPRFIRQDISRFDPAPANNRLKVWRSMCTFWVEHAGLLEVDPAREVRKRKMPTSTGFSTWTREDIAAFRAYWPHHTAQRRAFELMYRTCASIGDVILLGPGMVSDGWLTYRRKKSKSEATSPFTVSGPDWFEADHHLAECLKYAPKALTFLATERGLPRSPKAAAGWFSRACTKAGLDKDKAAHGIRKHRASVFKENGATLEQRMAILGHETEDVARNYSRSAELRKTIEGTESSKPLSNFSKNA